MPEIIKFEDAIAATEDMDRTLLLGNGFSAKYFAYGTLLTASGIEDGTPLRNVFTALDTVDFERVVNALENAATVERAYGHDERANELTNHAQQVREALVKAVNETHPGHRKDLEELYESSASFIAHFGSVFSLNYDLLLYWVNLEKQTLGDGFGLGTQVGNFRGPFKDHAHCSLFNLHGGLHLFLDEGGELEKALDSGNGVIATITQAITGQKRMPVYVAEGTSKQKMGKINSVAYLRRCYDQLRGNEAPVFVYGHSADENDAHVYRAIFESKAPHVYFGVFEPDEEKLKVFDGQLAKYQALWSKKTGYTFYDSGSAKVWEA